MKESYIFRDKPLPDIISYNLKILFIGYNPGLLSAELKHHYAHRSNRFWRLLFEAGLTSRKFSTLEDRLLLELGFGSTNLIDRPSKSADEIKPNELKAGSEDLYGMLQEIKPKIACYVGVGVYKAFSSSISGVSISKVNTEIGMQKNSIVDNIIDFVSYNPSGLNTVPITKQLNCLRELKELADNIKN